MAVSLSDNLVRIGNAASHLLGSALVADTGVHLLYQAREQASRALVAAGDTANVLVTGKEMGPNTSSTKVTLYRVILPVLVIL